MRAVAVAEALPRPSGRELVARRRLPRASRVFSTSPRDGWLVAGAVVYALSLSMVVAVAGGGWPFGWAMRVASVIGLAIGLVWMSNTVSHVHLHNPLFRSATVNRGFSLALTLVLGIPQSSWKRWHLRHHQLPAVDRGDPPRFQGGPARLDERLELALLLAAWSAAALTVPAAFFTAFLPVWALGLGLCALQGHYEHAGGNAVGVDHRGRLYNLLWFNDGHHSQHHRDPTAHWTTLGTAGDGRTAPAPAAGESRWPPLLRWLEGLVPATLDGLERAALGSRAARKLLLATHEPALAALVAELGEPAPRRICVVGGGLFPRTAILLGRLLPRADLAIVDADAGHLRAAERELEREAARARLRGPSRPARTTFVLGRCEGLGAEPAAPTDDPPFDLVVVPLALRGDRARFYAPRAGCHVLVHDWIWRRRGDSGRAVWPLLKRVNLVRARDLASDPGRSKGRSSAPFPSTLAVASAVEARAELPCRTIAPTTPTLPLPGGPVSSTRRPSPAFERAIARRS